MTKQFVLMDTRCIEMVSKVLSLVSKFSRKQAYIKIGATSVTVIWKQNNNVSIWARVEDHMMFSSTPNFRNPHRDHIVIQANPSTLARLFKGAGQQGKKVTINIYKETNIMRILMEPLRDLNSARTVTHTLTATHVTKENCSNLQLDDLRIDNNYDTSSVLSELYHVKHIMERFMALEPPKIYIWSKQGGDLTFRSDTQGSDILVSVSDLENGFSAEEESSLEHNRRDEAGVHIETKKIASFLSNCHSSRKARVRFEVAHNRKLRLTVDHENYHIICVLPHNL